MKKIDKLIITSFLGPFLLTFLVVVFILLMQHMLKYFDDIIGKDLGWDVLGTLLFYFAVYMTPIALPLAVLLSSLITFGNLGEHFELTAIKSLGVSLTRAMIPIFFFVVLITGVAFLANNYLVPKAALEAYSLLYDIKQKKPSLDLKEGVFYSAIPDVNIKVNKKYPDGVTLEGIVIYNHRGHSGNHEVTVADSGKMFTIMNNRYLKLELFRGYNYSEGNNADQDMAGQSRSNETLSKSTFDESYVIYDLSTFMLERTDKKWFQSNRMMRNLSELTMDMDSVDQRMKESMLTVYENLSSLSTTLSKSFEVELPESLELTKHRRDSLRPNAASPQASVDKYRLQRASGQLAYLNRKQAEQGKPTILADTTIKQYNLDSLFASKPMAGEITSSLVTVRMIRSQLVNTTEAMKDAQYEFNIFLMQWHKILASSVACLVMFFIGAPLGAIIKKGGLGVPVLISILFFILFYVMGLTGEKWAKQLVISVPLGVWAADGILMIFGLIFLRQARLDARLFESDFYQVILERFRSRFGKKTIVQVTTTEE